MLRPPSQVQPRHPVCLCPDMSQELLCRAHGQECLTTQPILTCHKWESAESTHPVLLEPNSLVGISAYAG